jgi:hypothetical protein
MKLSEKLAALEQEESRREAEAPSPAPVAGVAKRTRAVKAKGSKSWPRRSRAPSTASCSGRTSRSRHWSAAASCRR